MADSHSFSLIGLPGVGKTTWGRNLARELGWKFIDVDAEIERRYSASPRRIIEELGEESFRDKETETLNAILAAKPQKTVISCGGGIVLREENRRLLRENTIVLYLKKDRSAIKLSEKDLKERPLLSSLETILEKRGILYETTAHKVINIK